MLLELNVEDFALIDRLSLEFGSGLNIITGETGAGKSILLDAVSLLLGARAQAEMIRTGCTSARVEGVFEVTKLPQALKICEEAGLEAEDGLLVLSREISQEGRNRCWVNGRASTVTFFSDLGKKLVDLHGQHAHQSLLYPENHLRLLDSFGDQKLAEAKLRYLKIYDQWKSLGRRLEKILAENEMRQKRKELLEFQIDEIIKANLQLGEDTSLLQERERLRNADSLFKLSQSSTEALSGENYESFQILDPLRKVVENLHKLARLDDNTKSYATEAEDCLYRLEELARDLRVYSEGVEFNPERLEAVEARLHFIETLKRKYGNTIEEILEFANSANKELAELVNDDEAKETLCTQIQKLAEELGHAGEQLANLREEAFSKLKQGVEAELKDLYMDKAVLGCSFLRKEDMAGIPAFNSKYLPHLGGLETIEFLFSANPGEELKSLSKIASGGEMSRLMLAFKLVLAGADNIPTLIFDEIDAGVGGKTGQAVAEKLASISKYHQVLCVTHLPQIAAMADYHFYIEKKEEAGRTVTRLQPIDNAKRHFEISRMLSGDYSESSIYHAMEMIKKAEEYKETVRQDK